MIGLTISDACYGVMTLTGVLVSFTMALRFLLPKRLTKNRVQKMTKYTNVLLVVLVMALLVPIAQADPLNLISLGNFGGSGGFEWSAWTLTGTGSATPDGYSDGSPTGFTCASVGLVGCPYQAFQIDGAGETLSQTFATNFGDVFDLSLDFGGNPWFNGGIISGSNNTLLVIWNGVQVASLTGGPYQYFNLDGLSSGANGQSTLALESQNTDGGIRFTNINVTDDTNPNGVAPAAEVPPIGLVSIGCTLLALAKRRFHRS